MFECISPQGSKFEREVDANSVCIPEPDEITGKHNTNTDAKAFYDAGSNWGGRWSKFMEFFMWPEPTDD